MDEVEEIPAIKVEIPIDSKRDGSPVQEDSSRKISDLAMENIQKSQSQSPTSPQEEYYN